MPLMTPIALDLTPFLWYLPSDASTILNISCFTLSLASLLNWMSLQNPVQLESLSSPNYLAWLGTSLSNFSSIYRGSRSNSIYTL